MHLTTSSSVRLVRCSFANDSVLPVSTAGTVHTCILVLETFLFSVLARANKSCLITD